MCYLYKSKTTKQKETNQPNKKIPPKRNANVQTCNSVCNFYRTFSNNSNNCVQMARFIPMYYGSETEYVWTPDYQNKLNIALQVAVRHLDNALNDPLIENNTIIQGAIQGVKNVLNDQNLEIYPLTGNCYGMAQPGSREISINMGRLRSNLNTLAKTLIHESFHIIGGCTREEFDTICSGNLSKEKAYDAISKVSDISIMSADYFAQYIMKC